MVAAEHHLYYNFLLTPSLKFATIFTKEDSFYGGRAPLNAIPRYNLFLNVNIFKPLQHTVATTLYGNALYAQQEMKKFLQYIDKQMWLLEPYTLYDAVLEETVLIEELNESKANERPVTHHFYDAARDTFLLMENNWCVSVLWGRRESYLEAHN